MPHYTSGAEVLADARIRLDAEPDDAAILIVEGRDDFLVFAERTRAVKRVVIAGNKTKALDAHRRIRSDEQDRFVVIVDRDYDVAAGRLQPSPGLIITRFADMEVDFIELGIAKRVALRSVPSSRESNERLAQVSDQILKEAIRLAEAVGRLRFVSSVRGMGLVFDGLEIRKFRDRRLREVDSERLAHAIAQRSRDAGATPQELLVAAEAAPSGLSVCSGKDLRQALAAVVHQDFGVNLNELGYLDELFTTVDSALFEAWSVVERLRQWEDGCGHKILS